MIFNATWGQNALYSSEKMKAFYISAGLILRVSLKFKVWISVSMDSRVLGLLSRVVSKVFF